MFPNSPVFINPDDVKSPGIRCATSGILNFSLLSPTHVAFSSQASCELAKNSLDQLSPSSQRCNKTVTPLNAEKGFLLLQETDLCRSNVLNASSHMTKNSLQENDRSGLGKLGSSCNVSLLQQSCRSTGIYSPKVCFHARYLSSETMQYLFIYLFLYKGSNFWFIS